MDGPGEVVEAPVGAELQVALERVTDQPLPRELSASLALAELDLATGREHPLFLVGRQRDQFRVWTSALFVTR